MSSVLPEDITQRIAAHFPIDHRDAVNELLCTYQGYEQLRIVRCLIHLSNGDIELLKANLKAANQDYRDIIFFAEYDTNDVRIHNFSEAFEP